MELIVDGRYLATSTAWGDLNWGLCWPGYSDELTFDVSSHPNYLRPGVVISLIWGGEVMFRGTLDEPVRGQKLRAAGLHRLLEDYAALDSGGNLSIVPWEAMDAAIVRGLPITRNISFTDFDEAPLGVDSPSTMMQLVEANAALFPGEDWGVLPNSQFRRFARPTPRLHVRPGGDGLGIAWDNYASTLIARYFNGTTYATVTRTDPTAEARWGYREAIMPNALNGGATLTPAQAEAALDSMLAAGRSRPGWTQAIEVQYGAVLNNQMQPVDLATIKPYETIRVHGLTEDVGDLAGQSYVDMPIARINHNPKAGTATLTPVGLVSPMSDVLSGKRVA